LCDRFTQTVSFTFESPGNGFVAKLLVEPNVEIKGHDKLAVLVSSEKDLDQFTEKVRALLVSLVLVRGLSRLRVQMNARICHRAK
jgi:hypothetical protein